MYPYTDAKILCLKIKTITSKSHFWYHCIYCFSLWNQQVLMHFKNPNTQKAENVMTWFCNKTQPQEPMRIFFLMLNFTSHTRRGHMLALAPSTVPKCLPAWRGKSLLWLPSDLSLDCRKRGKGQICVGIRKRLLSEPLARKWVHSTTGNAEVSFSQNVSAKPSLSLETAAEGPLLLLRSFRDAL